MAKNGLRKVGVFIYWRNRRGEKEWQLYSFLKDEELAEAKITDAQQGPFTRYEFAVIPAYASVPEK